MGKMLILLVVSSGILLSIGSLNMNRSNLQMASNSIYHYEKAQAKNYAASGIEWAIKEFNSDTTWAGVSNKQTFGGTISVAVQTTGSKYFNGPNLGLTNTKLVTSIGRFGTQYDTIRAIIQLPMQTSTSTGVPGFLKYAVASGEELELSGNVLIRDDNNPAWNANIHTNDDFEMNGNNTVKGFLTYVGTASSNPAGRLGTSITPNQNPDGDPAYSQTGTVSMPDFNPDDYLSKATTVHAGNITYSGSISLGTKENPQIIYVGGNLTISGTVTGYGVFIVKGNIIADGSVTVSAVDPLGNNLGLYAKGNIDIAGNTTIKAQVYVKGNAEFGGNSKLYGAITAKGEVDFHGTVDVYYRPGTEELTKPFWAGSTVVTSTTKTTVLSYYVSSGRISTY